MNRRRSSDSLDNGGDDIICSSSGSSSPTDFTSDDETNTDNLFLISGQPSSKPVSTKTSQPIKSDKYSSSNQHYRNNYPLQSRHNILRNPNRPIVNNSEQLIPSQLGFIDEPSTSYYDDGTISSDRHNPSIGSLSSRIPDIVPHSSSIALLSDQPYGHRINQLERDQRSIIRNRRVQSYRGGHSSNNLDSENGENLNAILADDDEEESVVDLFGRPNPQLEPTVSTIANTTRGMNTIAVLMCAKLVECRSLMEAIELIDLNRDLIDNLTSIITREAPAFRNYDMRNYQVDYSVKESFNPNFWLDREPIVTTADGNCQYNAVSLSLTGSELYTSEVRLATAVSVIENREWFDSMLKLIDRGSVLDLVHTIARSYSWGDETTLKAIAVAINRRIFLYTCNMGKKDYEMVKLLSKEELLDAFKEKKYRGGTGIHAYADPLIHVPANDYIMLFHKSEHFIAVLPTSQQPTMFEPYNPIVPIFN